MESRYRLSDDVIAQIARSLQLALLTGTDIIDHLRSMELRPSITRPESLELTPEYQANAQRYEDELLSRADQLNLSNDEP